MSASYLAIFTLFLVSVFLKPSLSSKVPTFEEFYAAAKEDADYTIQARRYLHQHPERYLREYETSEFIKKSLSEMGVNFTGGWAVNTIDPSQGEGGTGVVAMVGTGHPPCIGLRADFDGLPINEMTDVPFKSTHDGMMHACGHDAHTAMLLGAARMMKKYESQMKGTVKFFFQPGEEGGAGGKFMVDEGCQTMYPPNERVFGFHVGSNLPTGVVSTTYGPSHAAAEDFIITVKGKGGHAANHHMLIDPLPAAAAIVRAMYDIYAREMYFQIESAGIISVTYVHSGEGASNVIPDFSKIGGTLRSPKTKNLEYLKRRVREVAKEVAEGYRCTAEVERTMIIGYPALENDYNLVDWTREIFKDTPIGQVQIGSAAMGGEDFSFFSQEVPAVFFRIGTGSGSEIEGHVPTNVSHHHPYFAVDERVFAQGVAMHCHLAFQSFEDMMKNNTATETKTDNEQKDEL